MPNYQINLRHTHTEPPADLTPSSLTPDEPRAFRCRHIRPTGARCGSPALRNESFCFYHHSARRRPPRAFNQQPELTLPLLEDRASIVQAVSEILARLASRALDRQTAVTLLYGLQIASNSLPREPRAAAPSSRSSAESANPTAHFVDEIIDDPDEGPIAPIAELLPASGRRSGTSLLGEYLDEILSTPPTPCPDCGHVRDLAQHEHEHLEDFEKQQRGAFTPRHPDPDDFTGTIQAVADNRRPLDRSASARSRETPAPQPRSGSSAHPYASPLSTSQHNHPHPHSTNSDMLIKQRCGREAAHPRHPTPSKGASTNQDAATPGRITQR